VDDIDDTFINLLNYIIIISSVSLWKLFDDNPLNYKTPLLLTSVHIVIHMLVY